MRSAHLLHVNLNVLLQIVLVEVQHQVVHKVEAVAHNDEGQLVGQLGLLQEVLHALWIVHGALATDALHLLDLPRLHRRLDVLVVHLAVLAEVHNGPQEVEQACAPTHMSPC